MEINYDLELEKASSKIKEEKAGVVCIQLPDGLKEKATEIAKYLEEKTKAKIVIWLGSCWGACDIPNLDVDLLIQWGHSDWDKL
ncbi:diphthamide synthesis protein [Candidatus Woesearchaeota archaeon]|nr:diphthamide synthesis protein [Candidatus Woesearchaeota archaeon]